MGNFWPAYWWRYFEIRGIEVKMSGEEVVEFRHAGNDFVAVVWHDDERLLVFQSLKGKRRKWQVKATNRKSCEP